MSGGSLSQAAAAHFLIFAFARGHGAVAVEPSAGLHLQRGGGHVALQAAGLLQQQTLVGGDGALDPACQPDDVRGDRALDQAVGGLDLMCFV